MSTSSALICRFQRRSTTFCFQVPGLTLAIYSDLADRTRSSTNPVYKVLYLDMMSI